MKAPQGRNASKQNPVWKPPCGPKTGQALLQAAEARGPGPEAAAPDGRHRGQDGRAAMAVFSWTRLLLIVHQTPAWEQLEELLRMCVKSLICFQ